MRLMAGHCRRRIIQYAQDHIRFIIQGIHNSGHTGCKKGRVTDKCKADGLFIHPVKALCHSNTGSHTKTGIHHIKRHGISKGIAANITAEITLPALHCLLYRIKGSPVGTSCT